MAKQEILTEDDPKPVEELVITETAPKAEPSDDDDHDEEPTISPDASEADREAIRERRRLEKAERKERREKAISRDKLEMDFLRKRNDDLERRFVSLEQRQVNVDVQNVDRHLRDAMNDVDMAEKVIAKAVAAGNGDDVAQAMRYRDQAIAKAQQLNAVKQQTASQPRQQAPKMDDMTLHYAKEFVQENKWYDPQGKDEDSAIVLAIDQTLVRDGYAPNSEEYWTELRKRAARRLPDRFNGVAKDDRIARGGPAIGSGREHAPTSTRKEIYISPERKAALMEAGVWDDPVLRNKYVKRYAEYDRNNRA